MYCSMCQSQKWSPSPTGPAWDCHPSLVPRSFLHLPVPGCSTRPSAMFVVECNLKLLDALIRNTSRMWVLPLQKLGSPVILLWLKGSGTVSVQGGMSPQVSWIKSRYLTHSSWLNFPFTFSWINYSSCCSLNYCVLLLHMLKSFHIPPQTWL